jgi:hypothetical protein
MASTKSEEARFGEKCQKVNEISPWDYSANKILSSKIGPWAYA